MKPRNSNIFVIHLGKCYGAHVNTFSSQKNKRDHFSQIKIFGYRSRRKWGKDSEESLLVRDEDRVNNIFFAHQIVPDSCATHALISILLNCPDEQGWIRH